MRAPHCTYSVGLAGLLFFVFVVAPFAGYAFYDSTRHTVLDLRTPPVSSIPGQTVEILGPHFNKQMSHHPLYYAAFSRSDNVIWFLEEMSTFFTVFEAAVKASFIGPHITIIQSDFNIPTAGSKDVLSPDWRTTLVKLDNNMSALDQRDVIDWMRTFASGYARAHANFSAIVDIDVTGVGAMTESLRDAVWVDMIIVAAVGIALASLTVPFPLLLEKWAVLRGVRTPGADALIHLVFCTTHHHRMASQRDNATSSRRPQSNVTVDFPLYFFSRRRILLSGFIITFFGTLALCFTALSTMWLCVHGTATSSLAPILGFLVLCPLSCIFISGALETSVFTILRRRVEAEIADQDRRSKLSPEAKQRRRFRKIADDVAARDARSSDPAIVQRSSTSYAVTRDERGDLNASLLAESQQEHATDTRSSHASSVNNNDDHDEANDDDRSDGEDSVSGYAFGFDGHRTPFEEDVAVYVDARTAVAPWLVVSYTAALLLCGALWLVHVEAVSSAGCGVFFALAFHGPLFFVVMPYAMACGFPSSAMQEFNARVDTQSSDDAPLIVRTIQRGASSPSLGVPDSSDLTTPIDDDDSQPAPEKLSAKAARIVTQWMLRPPSVPRMEKEITQSQRSLVKFVVKTLVRCFVTAGLIAVCAIAITNAQGNVAFFREVPRDAAVVKNGHRLLQGIGAATAGPYNLVFKTHATGGLLEDPNAFTYANDAMFETVHALGFDIEKVSSITHANFIGFPINISLTDADILLLLKTSIGNSYAYLWDISVDPTNTYFQLMLYPDFNPFGQDAPVATQQRLDSLVERFRKQYSGTFEFIGWYGANSATWAAMVTALPRMWKWTGISIALLFVFVSAVWLRWGNLEAPTARIRAVSRPKRRDPLAPVPSAASTCTRLAFWRIGRSIAMGAGYSVGVIFPVVLSVCLAFAFAIWMFQYGAQSPFKWPWPILKDIEGVSWLVIPILVPAATIPAFAVELVEWLSLHNEQRRSDQLRSSRRRVAAPATTALFEVDDIFESNVSPRSKLSARLTYATWIVAFATLGFSKTVMINEVGVVLAGSALFQMVLVGPLLREPLAMLLDFMRRRL